jgi:N-acylneuraminate cytidylyltransferase
MRDGMGLEILRQHQVEVIVMTRKLRSSGCAYEKNYKSNIAFLGVKDKFAFLTHFLQDREKLALRK